MVILAVMLGLTATLPLWADDPKPDTRKSSVPPPPPPEEPIRPVPPPPLPASSRDQRATAAALVVAQGDPRMAAALVQCADLWAVRPARPVEMDPSDFTNIEDNEPLLVNPWETQSFCYTLLRAHEASPEELRKAATDQLGFRHFWKDPQDYRGRIVHIVGRLHQLTPDKAPPQSQRTDGIKTIYEAWVFPGELRNPYCIYFLELPPGFKVPSANADFKVPDYPNIACDAYFFKNVKYKSTDKAARAAPTFVGRSFALVAASAQPEESGWSPLSNAFITVAMVMVVLLIALIVGLNWWFRQGDKATRQRLDQTRKSEFIPPTDTGADSTAQSPLVDTPKKNGESATHEDNKDRFKVIE
jgi:hypothetical protein